MTNPKSMREAAESAANEMPDDSIIAKLPRTADGKVVLPGDTLFYIDPVGFVVSCSVQWGWHKKSISSSLSLPVYQPESMCYSTREAAEEAQGKRNRKSEIDP